MTREYYSSSIEGFKKEDADSVLGQLLINNKFETTNLQKNAWRKEILILKDQLSSFTGGDVIEICPVAFEIFERLKKEYGFRARR